ncbi:S1/P1 nuclease [Paraurantiacibacter namhicola]|uniref:S1/P1 Nuclease n=1 Tax=Paraurantiacibacter namhicola TaxID=645517 RepID=A0A1C7D812_9SPHN|nr:S1/P1 nuclease [Paraurantiacibacter namhicola]ANU07451.1 S1/P1 Nuclease [Paraurantiacibacter namhicola]
MKRPLRAFALSAAAIAMAINAAPAAAWGPIGHRVTGALAERNIDGHTRAQITQIIGNESLAEASTWPDEQRSNPAQFWQETASPWHYVTLPDGRTIDMLEHPAEGDAATALEMFAATLRDPEASQADKARALRFVVHLVGDLHMPLHVGNGTDRGGNDFVVLWFDQMTNLHWVWDEGMIVRQQLSYSEYADRLARRTTPANVISWWDARPETWMQESADLRMRIYPSTGEFEGMGTAEAPRVLKYQYNYDWTPTMEMRLQQAGVRIAAYLDWVFAPQC